MFNTLMKGFDYSLRHPLSTIPTQILKRSYPAIFLENKYIKVKHRKTLFFKKNKQNTLSKWRNVDINLKL